MNFHILLCLCILLSLSGILGDVTTPRLSDDWGNATTKMPLGRGVRGYGYGDDNYGGGHDKSSKDSSSRHSSSKKSSSSSDKTSSESSSSESGSKSCECPIAPTCASCGTMLGTCGDKCTTATGLVKKCTNVCAADGTGITAECTGTTGCTLGKKLSLTCNALSACATHPPLTTPLFVSRDALLLTTTNTQDNPDSVISIKKVLDCACTTGFKIATTSVGADRTTLTEAMEDNSNDLTYELAKTNCPDMCILGTKTGAALTTGDDSSLWTLNAATKAGGPFVFSIATRCTGAAAPLAEPCLNYGAISSTAGVMTASNGVAGPATPITFDFRVTAAEPDMTSTSNHMQVKAISCSGCTAICKGIADGCVTAKVANCPLV